MEQPTSTQRYKCIYFVATLYMAIMACSAILANKLIALPFGILSAASIISPFWFMLTDIIAEVYGYKMARSLFWSVIVCQFLLAFTCFFIIRLNSPDFWHGQDAYELVTGHLVGIALFALVGSILSWKINTHLLLKWKALLKGRYFWLRSLGSSIIGEIIFSILSVTFSLIGMFEAKVIFDILIWSCIFKIIGLIVLSPLSAYIVYFIKKIEGPIESDYSVNPILNY